MRYQIHVTMKDGNIISSIRADEQEEGEVEKIKGMMSQSMSGQWDSFSIDIDVGKWITMATSEIQSITISSWGSPFGSEEEDEVDEDESKLGHATTRELLEEVRTRAVVDHNDASSHVIDVVNKMLDYIPVESLNYRTVDS